MFDLQFRTRLVFGRGVSTRVGELARDAGFRRTLLVADKGLVATGQIARASRLLEADGLVVIPYHEFGSNPDSAMVEAGRAFAAPHAIDSIVAWGGGSALDCAKGINFLLTNGGRIQDYRGYGKASRPLLPMIAVPTTAGTGSEVQSYAVISDASTHEKMACGDPTAAFRLAILDPELTTSQPFDVTAASGFDAIAHAVETAVTRRRNAFSSLLSREAWRRLALNFERVLSSPGDLDAREEMQLGACLAGMAIESSMLGAAHACANPLTARYGTPHGHALAALLPHVVHWNAASVDGTYRDLLTLIGLKSSSEADAAAHLSSRLAELAASGRLTRDLRSLGATEADLPELAARAATQWTGTFNPRQFDAAGALEIYRAAY